MSDDVGAQAVDMRRISTPRGNPVELGDTHEGEKGAIPKTPQSRQRRRDGKRDSLGQGTLEKGKIDDENVVADITKSTTARVKIVARSPTISGRSPTVMARRESMSSSPVSPTIFRSATLSAMSRGGSPEETEKEKEARIAGKMGDWLLGMPPTMPFHRGQVLIVPESAYAQGSPRMRGSLTAREPSSWRDSWKAEDNAAKQMRGRASGSQTARTPEKKRIELVHLSREEKQERRMKDEMRDVLHTGQAAHISKMTKAHRMLDADRMNRTDVLKQKHKAMQEKLLERGGSIGQGLGMLGGGRNNNNNSNSNFVINNKVSSSISSGIKAGTSLTRSVDLLPRTSRRLGHGPGGGSELLHQPSNRDVGGGGASQAMTQSEKLPGFERLTTTEVANAKVSGVHGADCFDLDQFRERAYPGMKPVMRVTSPHSMAVMKKNGVVETDIAPRSMDSFLELSGKERALVGAKLRQNGMRVEDANVRAGHVEMWAQLLDAESSSRGTKYDNGGGGGGGGSVEDASSPGGVSVGGGGGAVGSPGRRDRAAKARGNKVSGDEKVARLKRRFKTASMRYSFEENSRLDLIDKLIKERRRRINASTVLVPGKAGDEPDRQLLAFGAMAKASFVAKGHGSKPPGLSYVEETSVAVVEKARAKQAKMEELERAKTEREIRDMIAKRDSLQDLMERTEETEANREKLLEDLQVNLRVTRTVKMSDASKRFAAIQQDKVRELQELDEQIAEKMGEAEERHEEIVESLREKAKDRCLIAGLKYERSVKMKQMETRALEARGAELEGRGQSSQEVMSRIQAEKAKAAKEVEAARLKMLRKRGKVKEIVETFKETGQFEVAAEDMDDVGELGQIVQLSSSGGKLEHIGEDMNEVASWLPQNDSVVGMVPADSYAFFKMEHCNEKSRISITLRCLDGFAELLIGNGHVPTPTLEGHTWKATGGVGVGDKKVILHPFDKGYTLGMLYVGVYGSKDCTYELLTKWHDDRKPRDRWGGSSSGGQTRSTTAASRGVSSASSSVLHDEPRAKSSSSRVVKSSLTHDSSSPLFASPLPEETGVDDGTGDNAPSVGNVAQGGVDEGASGAHSAAQGSVQSEKKEVEVSQPIRDESAKSDDQQDYSDDEDFVTDGPVESDGDRGGGAGIHFDVPRHMSTSRTLSQIREMDNDECMRWLKSLDVCDEGLLAAAGLRLTGAQLCEMRVEDFVKKLNISNLQAKRIAMNRV